jgi:hypothetical protein
VTPSALLVSREASQADQGDDPEVDLDGIEALAAAAGLTVKEYLQGAASALVLQPHLS